ncbi:tail fiber domain-containing protein [Stenotrophomonas maltophilia]|uniref:phage tail protein n=1 Tax=Stenotrophomonas maltophilia TaxID=40324 RepID=UPI000C15D13E|nr:phage tail protein [Stenotrophomonas maltophilia]UXB21046.1 tail fiber domain-containing protein [Stenotrophomonas maltophilia]
MRLKITDAGFAKLVNPPNTGTNAVLITQIGLTSTAFVPSAGLTALPGEIKRVATFGGQAVGDDTVHVTIRDDSATSYTLRGFGLYLADGTLFASYGQADPIMEKSAASMLLLATDTRFSGIDTTQIQFGDAGFLYPPATTEVVGVVELATSTEAEDATDTQRAVTPRGVRAYTDKRFGASAPTALAKTLLSAANTAAARTALELKSAALKDTGHGNGLDADTLDGKHASEFALAGDFATVGHKHVIADVTGLQSALDGKASRGGNTFTDQQFIAGSSPLVGFGSSGAEQSFIGGWANTGLWRVWSTDRSASSEITIKHGDGPRWNGSAMWHAGNFAPDSKINLTGGTFTGNVTIKSNSLRLSGWGNAATDGVVYFGSGDSYLFKSGSAFSLKNVEGGFTATINSGGTVWTSGNFDPASKVNKAGDVMPGALRVNNAVRMAAGADRMLRVMDFDGRSVIQGVNDAESEFTPVEMRGSYINMPCEVRPLRIRIPHDAYGTEILWNQLGSENGYGCSEYINYRGGGTGGHVFYAAVANVSQRRTGRITETGNIDSYPTAPNPGTGVSSFGFRTGGSFGGGYGMTDGGLTCGIYMQSGGTNIGFGSVGGGVGQQLRIDQYGNLNVVGAASANGGFDVGSSRKLKEIDSVVPYGLADVERMELASGHYKPEYNDDGRRRLFFVAEQLAELVPEAVDLEGVEFQGERVASVKLDQLLPVMAKAIQELAAEVRALKAER